MISWHVSRSSRPFQTNCWKHHITFCNGQRVIRGHDRTDGRETSSEDHDFEGNCKCSFCIRRCGLQDRIAINHNRNVCPFLFGIKFNDSDFFFESSRGVRRTVAAFVIKRLIYSLVCVCINYASSFREELRRQYL